ncbi:MAG TPA: autotransporter outer membrane beta-barrel domain-containing protein [Burkholderiales bacterium]|nr:autotransporter outer membrane beta-barrel domain-containing protein [Burkholderiales bacterium]
MIKQKEKTNPGSMFRNAALVVLTAISPIAAGVELVTNGTFETGTGGTATGWSVQLSNVSATMARSNVPLSSCCATVPVNPIAGFSMMTTQTGGSSSAAFQLITIPLSAHSLTFSGSVIGNLSTTASDVTRIDILPNSANPLTGTALATLYVRDGTQGNQALTTITAPVTGLNGQTVMLRLFTNASSNPNMFAFDNISLAAVLTSNVFAASQAFSNTPAFNAAQVIDANPNLQNLFSALSTDQQISNAATQTLPVLFGASSLATQGILSNINHLIEARQDNNRGKSSGDDFSGDRNFWLKPFGSQADQKESNGAAGYKANTYGVAFGFDGSPSTGLRLGGAFAYAKSDITARSSVAPQSADINVYHLIGYGNYSFNDRTYVNVQADVGQNTNRGRRNITFASSVASSDYDSYVAHVGVGLGHTYALSSQTKLTPSIRADYTWIKDKSYTETGAGLLNLNVDSRTTKALVFGMDGKLALNLNAQTTLVANLGVGYDALSKQAALTATFAGAPGASFVTSGIDPSPWLARGGIALAYRVKGSFEVIVGYAAEVRERFLNQTASVKARWSF